MALENALRSAETAIVDEALADIRDMHVHHYEAAGEAFTRQRLQGLFDLVVTAIQTRDLTAVITYAEQVATERFNAGFDVSEVQIAFNTLETVMWREVVASVPHEKLAESIGLLSTVLGVAKDALARKYVSLAADRRVPSLDLTALFTGLHS